MDIGEMQKRLSLKAEQQPGHRFDDLFSLIGCEDHLRPRCVFGWKPDADKPENLWTLGLKHHPIKTEKDRQRESRVH